MVRQIALSDLVPHPLNSNRMDVDTFTKLQRHIARCGRYEPLTVRPHPIQPGKFEVVNGHHRLKALHSLGHNTANCNVWELDDDQTHLYLATLNRLSGNDVPERRVILLDELVKHHDPAELAGLLPDPEEFLRAILQFDGTDIASAEDEAPSLDQADLPHIVTFMLSDAHAMEVNMAIDMTINRAPSPMTRGEALAAVARFYLKYLEESDGRVAR
jgi:hypothetical protein